MMNILAIGYYDDYARFFLAIKKELQRNNNNQFKYINIYLSGFLYYLINAKTITLLISFKAWVNVFFNKRKYKKAIEQKSYKNIDLDEIIKFDVKLNSLKDHKIKILKYQACSYIDIVEKIFITFKPDVLLLSDDSRLVIEVVDFFAKKNKIKIFYFEQGPFKTTIFDYKGVNANASIRDIVFSNTQDNLKQKEKDLNIFFSRKKQLSYRRNPIYRGIDLLLDLFFNFILPIDIRSFKVKINNKKEYDNLKETKSIELKGFSGKYILLILQVPFDVNMVLHSPNFKSHLEIVNYVYNSLPDGYNLIIREHPLYKSKYEKEVYELIRDTPNVYIDVNSNFENLIKGASIVVVNNSTVGIESIAMYKKTIVLGNCYYDRDEICFKFKKNLPQLFNKVLSTELNRKYIIEFLHEFCFKFLIEGHFRDQEIKETTINISNYILNYK